MSNKRDRRRTSEAAGYRAPSTAGPPERRGLLDSLFAPRSALGSPLPPLTSSLARGFVTVISTPAIVAFVAGAVLLEWVALVALGFQGPFGLLTGALAWPGPGTVLDAQLAASVFGSTGGALFWIFAFLLVRSLMITLLTTMIVERLRTGGVGLWSLRRSLRVLPVSLSVGMVGLAAILLAQSALGFLGQGLGFFAFVAALVVAVWLTAPAPAVAADEDRTMAGAMQRAYRVARVPGSGAITAATLYAFPAFVVVASIAATGEIGVNPSIGAWAVAIGVNLLHAVAAATWAYRYLAGAPFVDEAPPPRRAATR